MTTLQKVLFAVLWVTGSGIASVTLCSWESRFGHVYTDWVIFAVTWAWCLTLGVLLWTALA